jgi:Tfp pilus assembly protein PilO
MIRNVAQARKHVLIVIAVLLAIDAAAIAFLLSPAVGSGRARLEQYRTLSAELAQKRQQTIPALDMDQKLVEVRQQIADFYSRDLPGRYSEIALTLAKAADESHVEVANVRYDSKSGDTKLGAEGPAAHQLAQVNLSLELGGTYENEIRFINALERSKLLLVIESVNLAESQGGIIRLAIKMQTFLRTAES